MKDRGIAARRRRPPRLAATMLVGAMDLVGASIIAAAFIPVAWGRLFVLALAVALFTVLVDDVTAALVVAALGYALFVWFLADRPADPAWDIAGCAVPALAFGSAVALGRGHRWITWTIAATWWKPADDRDDGREPPG